jgi:cystathionine beta-lyase
MTEYNFDALLDRRGTASLKWDQYPEDVLPLWVADMDFRSPEPVIQALRQRVDHGIFGYPLGANGNLTDQPDLRQVIVERLGRLYGWQVQPEELVFVPGVVTGFNLAGYMLQSPGAGLLMQTPIYHPILQAPDNFGMVRQEASLLPVVSGDTANGASCYPLRYEIDFDAFQAAINSQTRLFILCNPHNPVGRVFRREELLQMAEICLRHRILICSDEIHCDLVFSGQRHIPIASLDTEIARNTITLMAPSKTYNIPGLKFSFAVIQNPELRQMYREASKGLVSWINVMGWVAALAAYREGQDWLDQLLLYLEANRDYVFETIQREMPQITLTKPEGTYLAWLDCRHLGLKVSPYEFFLQRAKVAFNDGKIFGKEGEGFVRLNFGCPRETLVEAVKRMGQAVGESYS